MNVPFMPLENAWELCELCVSKLCVPPVVLCTGGGSRLGAWGEGARLVVVQLPKILILITL
jgi:hypothetical protein